MTEVYHEAMTIIARCIADPVLTIKEAADLKPVIKHKARAATLAQYAAYRSGFRTPQTAITNWHKRREAFVKTMEYLCVHCREGALMFGDTSTSTNWTYVRRLFGAGIVLLGAFLLIEHIYNFGFEFYDIIGHEYLGLLLIFVGIGLNIRFDKKDDPEG